MTDRAPFAAVLSSHVVGSTAEAYRLEIGGLEIACDHFEDEAREIATAINMLVDERDAALTDAKNARNELADCAENHYTAEEGRALEAERDELRDALRWERVAFEDRRKRIEIAEAERDELRTEIEELKQIALNQQHFNGRLIRECDQAEAERDEARAMVGVLEMFSDKEAVRQAHEQEQLQAKMRREAEDARDEARAERDMLREALAGSEAVRERLVEALRRIDKGCDDAGTDPYVVGEETVRDVAGEAISGAQTASAVLASRIMEAKQEMFDTLILHLKGENKIPSNDFTELLASRDTRTHNEATENAAKRCDEWAAPMDGQGASVAAALAREIRALKKGTS